MCYIFLYFSASYLVIATVLLAVRGLWKRVGGRQRVIAVDAQRQRGAVAVFTTLMVSGTLLPFLPYTEVAIQTAAHGVEMERAVRKAQAADKSGNLGAPNEPIRILRVLSIDARRAEVYTVQNCKGGMGQNSANDCIGLVIGLDKTPTGWQFRNNWHVAWSDCGSAEGNTFPPFPEAKEF